jgi:sporulation protein YlmC with PRC-barrel domain
LELSVVVDGNSAQIVERERAKEMVIPWGKVQRVG